jgi:N-acetylglucosamine kinase-like BadF-type ATPase
MGRVIVDAGQSGVRVVLSRSGESDISREYTGIRSHGNVLEQVASAVETSLSGIDERGCWTLAAGITGLTPADGGANTLLDALPMVASVAIAHDSVTSYLGAFGNNQGTVLAVGTGVVVLACATSKVARVDGWGHLLGDAGGGFWIGARGLAAALEAFDGRAPSTSLTGAALERFGSFSDLPNLVYADPDRVSAIAAFCIEVVACAEKGDPPSVAILEEATDQLARSASASLDSVQLLDDDRVVSWSGKLIGASGYVRSLLQIALERNPARARLVPPQGTSLDGARALIDLSPTHPLYDAVSRASRNEK